MKKQFLLIIFIFSFLQQSFSQNPLVKQWDKRFGGTDDDILISFHQTTDGGYILGGNSISLVSGDKTQLNWGIWDFWVIKIDSLGIKQWDKRFGGTYTENLSWVQETADKGYILGGTSNSDSSGDKTQDNWFNSYDYWIVKTDSLGNKQWDKRFGGNDQDDLRSVQQTSDGGYILGGHSLSDSSGDKTQTNPGFWVIKTDSLGNKLWDKVFAGRGPVLQTFDGGYIIGSIGLDYLIVKVDSSGSIEWSKSFSCASGGIMKSLQQTFDGGYILGGYTNCGIGGDKTQPSWGYTDYWIIKTDSLGNKQWDKDFGGWSEDEDIGSVNQTKDGGYLVAGTSTSPLSGDKTESNLSIEQTWIVKTDSLGTKQWDKTIFTLTPFDDEIGFAIETHDGCFAIANYTQGFIGGYKSQPNWDTIIPFTYDYWIVKFCDTTSTTPITPIPDNPNTFSIYPNPANEYVTINYHFKAGDEIRLTDVLGKLLFTTKITVPTLNFKLQTLNLSSGIYFLKAGNKMRKFVKE